MFSLLKFFYAIALEFPRLLNIRTNVLHNIPDPSKYLAMTMLACFWCLAFGIYFGELLNIGYNMVGHIAIISMAFITWWSIRTYTNRMPIRGVNYLRAPDHSSRCDEYSAEQRTTLAAIIR
ncbi:hypothetical protein PKF032_14890 [Polynucleobacter yangtzensis]|uniref:Uncharacterized protein n=1 Tax=Polynucleobacter yangtzensis TaxID=1743159 RepID=A0ABN6TUM5_9BURK|nr:hypothetical protein PKF032_14890 [Polynucleobacter yangtzensis]